MGYPLICPIFDGGIITIKLLTTVRMVSSNLYTFLSESAISTDIFFTKHPENAYIIHALQSNTLNARLS